MLRELQQIFDDHQRDGKVALHYETELYYGQLSATQNPVCRPVSAQ